MKSVKDLAVELCKKEGKKQQVNVAQMSEIVHCLCVLLRSKPIPVLRVLLKRADELKK